MTREEAKELVTHSTMEANEAYNIIDKILNNHEAQLKAKDELLDKLHKAYAELEYECKAKDEEIAKYQMAIDKQSKRAEALKQLSLDKDNEIATAKMRHKLEHDRYLITEAIIKEKDKEIEKLKSYIEKLWQIVDDIDTYGDMAKSNDAMFRSLVENKQKERWELPITTDGYKLIYKEQQ